ncbi:hypothetical protein J416_08152 [Gracilibacillus halophilus YIM-C55.5]|uniref:DUF4247 domain-containing protein n=1 Tax=Gracilibacillus halophilus YIM-C55.5 TaxID=1308866 RepID=N4WL81_9BACI|nr:DUF4247 domain-containing protein [Gracilibacillus halophilus]ENH96942.1 hypothetical protein J416_08152 [Gracilibacillus halophilus YIM-C55.5]
MKRTLLFATIIFCFLLLSGCGSEQFQSIFNESDNVAKEDVQVDVSKDRLIQQLKNEDTSNMEVLISNHLPFVEAVAGEDTRANVYGTDLFDVQELADLFASLKQPDEISEYKDKKQVLVYNDKFIVLKESEELEGVTFIEVASDRFVRNNYSPNFLTTYFSIRLIDSLLGTNNWVNSRRTYCNSNDCYGGYSRGQQYNKGGVSSNRGMGMFRGGGPGSGK